MWWQSLTKKRLTLQQWPPTVLSYLRCGRPCTRSICKPITSGTSLLSDKLCNNLVNARSLPAKLRTSNFPQEQILCSAWNALKKITNPSNVHLWTHDANIPVRYTLSNKVLRPPRMFHYLRGNFKGDAEQLHRVIHKVQDKICEYINIQYDLINP